jgi:hypothetical protein
VAERAERWTGEPGSEAPPDFELEITRQGWITDGPESVREDLCSHGDIRLVIGGRVIAPGDGLGDYTISTSALALLRTLEMESAFDPDADNQLILCCGMILMTSCPIGIYWSVTHAGGRVRLADVALCEEIGSVRDFPGLSVDLTEHEYRRRIVAFAHKAKEPFVGIEKVIEEDWERDMYTEFWREYDARLDRAAEQLAG